MGDTLLRVAKYNTLISAAEVDSLYLSFGCGCRGYGGCLGCGYWVGEISNNLGFEGVRGWEMRVWDGDGDVGGGEVDRGGADEG